MARTRPPGFTPSSAPCDCSMPQCPHLAGGAGRNISLQGWVSVGTERVNSLWPQQALKTCQLNPQWAPPPPLEWLEPRRQTITSISGLRRNGRHTLLVGMYVPCLACLPQSAIFHSTRHLLKYYAMYSFQCLFIVCMGFPGGSDGKESACHVGDLGSIPWVGKIPWRREWLPAPVFLPGKFHGRGNLLGHSPWGHKELDTIEQLTLSHSHHTMGNLG